MSEDPISPNHPDNVRKAWEDFVDRVSLQDEPVVKAKIKLINGRLPIHTECPAKVTNGCGLAQDCQHEGVQHSVPYSCGALRFWQYTKEGRDKIET